MDSIKPVHLSDSRLQAAFLGVAVIAVLPSVSTQGDGCKHPCPSKQASPNPTVWSKTVKIAGLGQSLGQAPKHFHPHPQEQATGMKNMNRCFIFSINTADPK